MAHSTPTTRDAPRSPIACTRPRTPKPLPRSWSGSIKRPDRLIRRRPARRAAAGLAPRRPWWLIRVSWGLLGFEEGEVAGAGPVQRMAIPPGVEPDQVEGDRGVGVFHAGLIQAAVAGVAHAGDGYALADGAFNAGAQRVSGLEVLGVRGGPGGELRLVHLPGVHGELAALRRRGGAQLADRARSAVGPGEGDHDGGSAALGRRIPRAAGMAVRAGGVPGVEVDGERGAVEPRAGPGLR